MDIYIFHSLYQLIVKQTGKREHTKTPIDHIFANSPENVTQSGLYEM